MMIVATAQPAMTSSLCSVAQAFPEMQIDSFSFRIREIVRGCGSNLRSAHSRALLALGGSRLRVGERRIGREGRRAHLGLEVLGSDPTRFPDVDSLSESDHLSPGERRTYRWWRELGADDWVTMLATVSDHPRLDQERLRELQDTLRGAINASGGSVRSICGTYVWLSRLSSA